MANLKTKLKQKNETEFAHTIYIASSSDIVDRPDSEETVETSLQKIETTLPEKVNGIYKIYDDSSKIPGTPALTDPKKIIEAMENRTIAVLAISGQANTEYWPAKNGTFFAIRISQEFVMAFFQEVNKNSLYTAVYYKSVSTGQVTWSKWRDYNVALEFDDSPTSSSDKLLTSGTIYTALENIRSAYTKADTAISKTVSLHTENGEIHTSSMEKSTWNNKQNKLTFDGSPIMGSDNPITSGAVYTELQKYSPTSHNHDRAYIKTSEIGVGGGIVPLEEDGKISSQYMPSYVDDVLEGTYSNSTTFNNPKGSPYTPEGGKIYVDTGTGKTYRWTGSVYTEISKSLALGETSSTAYRGDRGKIAYDHSQTATTRRNTTATQILANGGTFKAISEVRDNDGHVIGTTLKTFTLPTIKSGISMIVRSTQPGASEQTTGDLWAESLS